MATVSPVPMLNSVLTTSNDNNNDFLNQLRTHLTEIENNFQQTLKHIQQRQPYRANGTDTKKTDPQMRNQFFDVLKEVAAKSNLPFDEPFYRQQFLDNKNSSSSPKVDVLRAKPSLNTDATDQHLSPVNNNRRSQFAPVLSSTPVHQISPNMPIPVDLTLATPSVAPVLTINSTDLPAVPPSAIVPQRANVGRPPRIPRSESNPKKISSPIHEQTEEIITVEQEVQVSSKRRMKTKEILVENNLQVLIEEETEIRTEVVKQVQSTPLRGRKKKVVQDDNNQIPQLEPPPPPPQVEADDQPEVIEVIPAKKTRAGRSKKKQEVEEEVKPTRTASVRSRKDVEVKPARTASVRGRKKQEEEEVAATVAVPAKKTTRSRKLVEPVVNIEEQPPAKLRATPSRGKKKSPVEQQVTPKKSTTKSRKRKVAEEIIENSVESIQPPSPKRRTGRNTKSKISPPIESPPPAPIESEPPVSTRSSRRGKKDVDVPIEKQEEIVLNKKTRNVRGKKVNQPTITDTPITVVDVVMTSVTVSAPTTTIMESSGSKPPRPPVARKKKSLAMPSISQTSPTTPPQSSAQRIQSTSPVNDKPFLPLPLPKSTTRRRPPVAPRPIENVQDDINLEPVSSTTRNVKRTRSSVASTPKRPRRDNLVVTSIPSTPGKKRNKCTCEKRRNRTCDICASALDV